MALTLLLATSIIAVAAVARWPRSPRAALVAVAAAGVALAAGSTSLEDLGRALAALAPAVAVLVAGLTLAGSARRSGLADLATHGLVRAAGGRPRVLYALVSGPTAL